MSWYNAVYLLCACLLCACDGDGFGKPTDVAFLSGDRPVVSDGYDNARIVRYLTKGVIDHEWGESGCGSGEFDIPHGITIDEQDRVYVADRGNARVQVFDADGNHLTTWGSDLVGRPWGIEYRAGILYIVDGGDQDPDRPFGRVVLMSTDGRRLGAFGSAGRGPGQFLDGHDIAVDSTGAVYVGEIGGRRVQKFVPQP